MKSRWTEPVLAVLFFALVSAVAWWGVDRIERETRSAGGQSLRTILQTAEQGIHLWFGTRVADAQGIAERPEVVEATMALLASMVATTRFWGGATSRPFDARSVRTSSMGDIWASSSLLPT
ncbi:MAG: hypothetical protein ACE5GX_10970 [Thermoanaerobaculia bacterium]